MSAENKARAAQLSVLNKYGVLADFSALQEAQLDRALKGPVSSKAAQGMTFAKWCDQLLGQGARVPVASFVATPGQTQLSRLSATADLAKSLKAQEKQHRTTVKGYQQQIEQLQAELEALRGEQASAAMPVQPWSRELPAQLSFWYFETCEHLHEILWDIHEVEGAFFEHQGQFNRDYRRRIGEIIGQALSHLDMLGFTLDVQLQEVPGKADKRPAPAPIELYRSQPREDDDQGQQRFEFVVQGVQADVIEAAGNYLHPERARLQIEKHSRFSCRVDVAISRAHALAEDDVFHLSCYMHKLFEAMARAGDKRPRGSLREKVILCLLLSRTAPCTTARHPRAGALPRLQGTFYRGIPAPQAIRPGAESDVSPGKIVEHLLHLMHIQGGY
ncbi:hypothetical protein N5D52_08555 [Pseudomonas sp. GD03860]|uniref:hypothetical protein n=1 Tax=Pseudomonas TaxID=286 RepID=UPI0023642CF2|nr:MULTISPECIES: hypothetical protein [Pseudomonas]MDD2058753.1 hypothetical protein [Pseudomonas putida]MDH0636986.1 hypothetical protein [Pseudomonas sp. GD03860]